MDAERPREAAQSVVRGGSPGGGEEPPGDPGDGWRPAAAPDALPGQDPVGDDAEGGLAPEDRRPGFHAMDVFMGLDAVLIALTLVAALFEFVQALMGKEPETLTGDVRTFMWINNAFVLVAFGVVPFLWILTTRVRPWLGTVRYFSLERPGPRILLGIGIGLLALLGTALIGFVAQELGVESENIAGDALAQALTWPLAFGIALSAAFGEEVFFRGILQKHLGWWGQAIVFALPHIYQGVFAVFLILGVGLLFGWVVHKGGGLWTVIAAHFCFNFAVLSLVLVT